MQTAGWLLYMLLQVYIWLLLARMIISWIPMFAPRWRPRGILASLFEIIYTLTDPPIRALRKIIPAQSRRRKSRHSLYGSFHRRLRATARDRPGFLLIQAQSGTHCASWSGVSEPHGVT